MNPPKKYGLLHLKSSSSNKSLVKKPSIFGNDSDEEDPQAAVNQMISRESTKSKLKRQTQIQIEDALSQDPTVYEYDSVYDTLHPNEQKKKPDKPEDRKSKYIGSLLRAAEERKKERERRVERQVQREREAEGGIYGDKEEFVTDAYRRKMAERQEEEERERRQEQMEAMLDVRKQSNLSGFYRHLLNQTTGEEAIPEGTTSSIAQTKDEVQSASAAVEVKKEVPEDIDRDLTSSDNDSDSDDTRQSRQSPRGDSQRHKRDEKHRRHHQTKDDKDDTRKERGREREGGDDRRQTERGQSHEEHRHSGDSADRDDTKHHQKKRHSKNDDASSSRHKVVEASDIDKQNDSKHKQNSDKSETQKAVSTKFAKHNVGECVDDAKARYLARKRALKAAIVKEDD